MYKAVLLLFTVFILAGCAQRAQGVAPSAGAGGTPIAVQPNGAAAGTEDTGAGDTGAASKAAITLSPASGYAGTFVGVTGTGWPPSAMVLIKLADAQGRSPVLAAVAADAKGQFTTGFVYPVGDRWLQPGAAAVVAHIESGQVETAASFAIAPPAGVQPPTSTPTNAPPSPTAVSAVTLPITATIPFTSGALAATLAPTVTPIPTATPLPTATPVPTALPSATAASTPTAAPTATAIAMATAAPSTENDAYSAPVSTIDELIAAIRTMPSGDLAPELANSLVQKLNNAQKQVDKGHATPAANMLRAFQHEVAAQWGKKIDDAAANFLTASADNVITHLQPDQPAENGNSSDNGRGTDENKGSDKGNGNDKGNGKGNGNANGNGNGNRNDKGNGKGKGHG